METLTHTNLVNIAAKWLYGTMRCGAVVTELQGSNGESPDAIGWKGTVSIVVECKVSRSDFLADQKKPFRKDTKAGMGKLRFYLTPKGLLKPADLEGSQWGLIETVGKIVKVILPSHQFLSRNMRSEIYLMSVCLQRTQLRLERPLAEVVSWHHRYEKAPKLLEEPSNFEYL